MAVTSGEKTCKHGMATSREAALVRQVLIGAPAKSRLLKPPLNAMPILNTLARHRIAVWRIFFLTIAAIYLTGRPAWAGTWVSDLLRLSGLLCVACAAMGRMWCALYISGRKNKELVVNGPYAICRHPLYLFNFIGFLGIAALTESLLICAMIAALFALYYPSVLASEERFLAQNFADFEAYKLQTPTFWPRLSLHHAPKTWEVDVSAFMRNVADSIWFLFFIGIVEMLDIARARGIIVGLYNLY